MVSRFGPSTVDPGSIAARSMRWHAVAYTLVIGGLTAVNIIQGAPWWALWPMLGWGLVLSLHWFVYKAINVDERWADERARELREYSYDFDHIKSMEKRIVDDDFSLKPHVDEAPTDRKTPERDC